jgi:hypothetical protein
VDVDTKEDLKRYYDKNNRWNWNQS